MINQKIKRSIAAFVFVVILCIAASACASTKKEVPVWVLCQPKSYVVARMGASKKCDIVGRLECGTMIYTDGIKKNNYTHVIICPFEAGEGWVHSGYLVYDEPVEINYKRWVEAIGRIKARKTINGARRRWLEPGEEVMVYWMSDSWAVTSQGFVMSKFIGGIDIE